MKVTTLDYIKFFYDPIKRFLYSLKHPEDLKKFHKEHPYCKKNRWNAFWNATPRDEHGRIPVIDIEYEDENIQNAIDKAFKELGFDDHEEWNIRK